MPTTFLDLPGELRNAIYELYLTDYEVDMIAIHKKPSVRCRPPALSWASRQIRTELLSIWKDSTPKGPNTWKAHTLNVIVDDFDFRPLRAFLRNPVAGCYRVTDVEVTFRFTDVSKIARHPKMAREWLHIDFTLISGIQVSELHWRFCYTSLTYCKVRTYMRLPPKVTSKAVIDMESLGGDGRDRTSNKRVKFNASSRVLNEIALRAKDAVEPGRRKAGERGFRTWLKLELLESDEKRRNTTFHQKVPNTSRSRRR